MHRRRERGVSLIEALIMLAIAGLAFAMLTPTSGRGAVRDFELSERAQDHGRVIRAEAQFRRLVSGAAPAPSAAPFTPALAGDARRLQMAVASTINDPWTSATLRVVADRNGESLVVDRNGRRDVLLSWREGRGQFAFDINGRWESVAGRRAPSRVRFSVDEIGLAWIEPVARAQAPVTNRIDRDVEGGSALDR